jgi:hypothetical protein
MGEREKREKKKREKREIQISKKKHFIPKKSRQKSVDQNFKKIHPKWPPKPVKNNGIKKSIIFSLIFFLINFI